MQNKASKAEPKEAAELESEASTLAKELAKFEIPAIPKLVVDDISPEQIASLLAQQGGRMAVLSAEGGIFEIMAGRYSQAGTANFEVFLKGYSGDTLRVDRVGRSPEYVRKPALSIGLTVQPEVIEGLFQKPGFRGRGLIPRFFFSLPKSMVGFRNTNPQPMSPNIRATYKMNITKILQLKPAENNNGDSVPHMLTLSPCAEKLSNEFAAWLEPQLADAEDLHLVRDWAGKLHGGIGRIAGIIHVAENINNSKPLDTQISEETFRTAIDIGKYLIPHAKAAFIEMGTDESMGDANYLLRVIKKEGKGEYSRQDLWQRTRGKFKTARRMDEALKILIENYYMQEKEIPDQDGPGRKKGPDYVVNPKYLLHELEKQQWEDEF